MSNKGHRTMGIQRQERSQDPSQRGFLVEIFPLAYKKEFRSRPQRHHGFSSRQLQYNKYCNKIKCIFGFPVHMNIRLTLCCSLLSVQ